ncbi:MAG: hypothetical protein GY866_28110 [Proteobacteria bacterium]|nr:hypothetical protein [Pseudomonadota bacterium]
MSCSLFAAPPVVLDEDEGMNVLGTHLDIPENVTGRWNSLIRWPNGRIFYVLDVVGNCLPRKACEAIPFVKRRVVQGNPVFHIKPRPQQRWYLQIQTNANMEIPLVIWNQNEFAEKVDDVNFFAGMLPGILLVMAFYNLFLLLTIWARSYLFFVLFILSYLLALDSGDATLAELPLKGWTPPSASKSLKKNLDFFRSSITIGVRST